jgi:hypothetical protein
MQPEIVLEDQSKLRWMDRDVNLFYNQMTIIYGKSKSGKTVVLMDIMHMLKDLIPNVFVICPTNYVNGQYNGIIPPPCILPGIDLNETADFLGKFVQRQNNLTNIYNKVNDKRNLEKLFEKLVDTDAINKAKFIVETSAKLIDRVQRHPEYNLLQKRDSIKKVESDRDVKLVSIYKTTITKFKEYLGKLDLSKNETEILTFLELNPCGLLILDDYASKFKQLAKIDPTIIKTIFFEGRHSNITTIILSQTDKEFDSAYRINVMCSIFTENQSATLNFNRQSNGYPKDIKTRAGLCIKAVYGSDKSQDSNAKNHKKLAFINSGSDQFRVFQAEIRLDFRMGGEAIWKFSDKLKKQEKTQKSNPLLEKYIK